jgi:hypothetical protein
MLMRFWGENLGHHPGKKKSEHNKKTSLMEDHKHIKQQLLKHIGGVSNNSSEHIGGVSNNSSEHIREVVSNFSDMYSEGLVKSCRGVQITYQELL